MNNILAKYKNGNYYVTLFEDGTKIIENDLDYIEADYPDNFDCKITNYCPMNCPMCHEKSTIEGKHADLSQEFFKSLHYGTEIALGGGMVTSHPGLVKFLKQLKQQGVFPNITVHQNELQNKWDFIKDLVNQKLIYGLGVSFHHEDDEFWSKAIKEFPNMVIHLIAGYHPIRDFKYLVKWSPKILILGYKNFGRGKDYIHNKMDLIQYHIEMLERVLFKPSFETQEEYEKYLDPITKTLKESPMFIEKFKVVSFDNLALEQLHIKNHISKQDWESFYQGEDGTRTMYIDAVKQQFARTSTSEKRYSVLNNIDDMFDIIKKEKENAL